MTGCFLEIDSVASISPSESSSSSSVSDRACVYWGKTISVLYKENFNCVNCFKSLLALSFLKGCVLSASETTAVFQAENDLLENQFFIKTVTSIWAKMKTANIYSPSRRYKLVRLFLLFSVAYVIPLSLK